MYLTCEVLYCCPQAQEAQVGPERYVRYSLRRSTMLQSRSAASRWYACIDYFSLSFPSIDSLQHALAIMQNISTARADCTLRQRIFTSHWSSLSIACTLALMMGAAVHGCCSAMITVSEQLNEWAAEQVQYWWRVTPQHFLSAVSRKAFLRCFIPFRSRVSSVVRRRADYTDYWWGEKQRRWASTLEYVAWRHFILSLLMRASWSRYTDYRFFSMDTLGSYLSV